MKDFTPEFLLYLITDYLIYIGEDFYLDECGTKRLEDPVDCYEAMMQFYKKYTKTYKLENRTESIFSTG